MTANSVFQKFTSIFSAQATSANFNYNLGYQKESTIKDCPSCKYALAQTFQSPSHIIEDYKGNVVAADVPTSFYWAPMTKTFGESQKNLTEMGQALNMLHEAGHANLIAMGERADEKGLAATLHDDIVQGLNEYNTQNNLGYSKENIELISWYGLQLSPEYDERFNLTGMDHKSDEYKAKVNEINAQIDAIIYQ